MHLAPLRIAAAGLLVLSTRAAAVDLALGQNGVVVPVKGMGEFTLAYPVLQPGERKPVRRHIDGRRVELTYPDDTGITLELVAGGRVEMSVHDVTKELTSLTVGTVIGTQ